MGRTSRIALTVLAAATVLAGCGGGEAVDIPEGVSEEQVDAVTEQVEAQGTFCEAAQANVDAGAAFNEFVRQGEPPRSAEEIEAVLEPLRDSNAQMIATAPDEQLRADLERVNEVQEVSLSIFESTGGDADAAVTDPAYAERVAEVAEANAMIRQYLRGACRISA